MANQPVVDVLIIEDTSTETGKIIDWFGLNPIQCKIARAFQNPTTGATADKGWLMVKKEIAAANPRVVVLDYLLTGRSGADPFDGIELGNRCKEVWPHLGVIIVTTVVTAIWRESSDLRRNLINQKSDHHWAVDYAWSSLGARR